MYPVLKPGLRRLWRDDTTLQLGADPVRAVVLTNLTSATAAALDLLDGTRSRAQVMAECDEASRELITLVEAEGLLDDAATDPADMAVPPLDQERFVPDVAAMSLRAADPTFARRLTDRRRRARLRVQGGGRVGAQVATLLAAGGIGTVVVDDAGVTTPSDVAPAGLRLDDVGRPRALASAAALARVSRLPNSRRTNSRRSQPNFRPDLVVVAPVGLPVVHPSDALDLERSGISHLLAGVRESTGVVGPLVVPGRTSCLHCQHLHRSAMDPAWPLLALQMSRRFAAGPDACEITLATFVASLAAMQALDFIDAGCRQHGVEPAAVDRGPDTEQFSPADRPRRSREPNGNPPERSGDLRGPQLPPAQGRTGDDRPQFPSRCTDTARELAVLPAAADGTLELAYPDWRIRRRSWPVHPACPCRRARSLAGEPADSAGPGGPRGPATARAGSDGRGQACDPTTPERDGGHAAAG